ncbi:MAG: anthranilate synthase component I family protein [Rhodothermaceae bacterium]|nr:anthranilate synthase component I family protein [Rhodothermaceae bacterium]MXZ59015.1 anthranilate synthase component I family protein [Rhodothermaceae bacterium]MYB91924.1 anthranilate synthase component I family protein [Rhodothermaceae bacterium]MYD67028.1 anthranilate synthase component I family protein [Rhodothermaceae bacterium]MYG44503.1 anthranilate synthase component I family protein [Rhodothermaceae bacterium]
MWALRLAAVDLQPLAQKYAQGHGLIWLDSSSRSLRFDRYSYLCIDPVESIPATAKMDDLRSVLHRYTTVRCMEDGPPFQGGLVGFFDYEFTENGSPIAIQTRNQGGANCHFRLYDTIVAVDHHADLTWIISSGFKNGSNKPCEDIAKARINAVRQDIRDIPKPVTPTVDLIWRNEITKQDYLKAVHDILDFIHAGDIYQANFAQTFAADLPRDTDPLHIYLSTRKSNPAPFSAYGVFGKRSIACTSPERLITVNAQGLAEARPIKGTIARSDYPDEDQQLRERLLKSEKDRAENIMIVDLLRNDLSRVCKPHSVRVPELCVLESYAGLHQLTSSVQGQLEDGKDAFDLLSAVFPGGSITGAPKRRSMEIIDQIEQFSRRAFCGSFGYFGFDGAADFNIMIRTIQFQDDRAWLAVGGGITSLSHPNEEYSETLLKAQKILDGTEKASVE